ncbi:MotA/TolQ/ExbB proton channel family protein [Thalassotalea sp. HSM 43]|uniref:MotA/TolQ/ExbB proton channel family protein n=1 Tax=Thalassotalea sp. HSM 43 TaxID=2552945 RepID=UPI00108019BC|nr:MotA/TolQ/ExbB proton channel family protein [Thalassotalea sp. HSM 43]QBY05323.1 MotA/TolQ/ExbB proton channel family protein [Thalassotalea sp. HSM 43]
MNKFIKNAAIAATMALTAGMATTANANQLDDLLKQIKADRVSEAKLDKKREQEFLSERSDKQALLNKAKAERNAENERNQRLTKQFADNETTLTNKEAELEAAKGDLGEMFGVVRRASGNAYGRIATSVVSAQYPGREQVLEKLANAKEIPVLSELEELWFALQTEMTESGKVATFEAEITNLDGSKSPSSITRIGSFNLISADVGYLNYNDEQSLIQPLGKQPGGSIVGTVAPFTENTSGYAALYLDPSKGTILNLETQKATYEERYHQGGTVGYVITVVLVLGLLIALERLIYLGAMGAKIRAQLKNTAQPNPNNPLGRMLQVYNENKGVDAESLELKLDEAILRETPKVERGINIIKIFAAIAPLLGLLGTVVGMIGTFQSITLYGTGDPKIMAGDISMALVTTAMGLIAALPLILIHSIVAGRGKQIFHILDEQSAGIIAEIAEKEKQ